MENYHTYLFEVEGDIFNTTIKDYLLAQGFSPRLIRKVKYEGNIWVNGLETPLYQKIKSGDQLKINQGHEILEPEPENIPISIIYEDHDLLAVNKDPFLVTHPVRRYPGGTLANAVSYYFCQRDINAKVRFINRLDRSTSGIILVSKNIKAHDFIQKQLKDNKVKKIYWALVKGILKNKQGTIDAPIGRVGVTSIRRSIIPDGQWAITNFKVLKEFSNMSLIELIPKTGRTHQLRVHMAYIGHPIVGDELYNPDASQMIKRQALHAKEISFIHPRTGQILDIIAKLSVDISLLIK